MSWHTVDAQGNDLATGRPPSDTGKTSPPAALLAAPVACWPVTVANGDRRIGLAAALGLGGERVEQLIGALVAEPDRSLAAELAAEPAELAALAAASPAGPVNLPLAVVGLAAGAAASGLVDRSWMSGSELQWSDARRRLASQDRTVQMDAAVHVATLLVIERWRPLGDEVDIRVATGALLWLLTGAVAWALASAPGDAVDPFASWSRLLAAGFWPVGPSGEHLVVCDWRPAASSRDR